MTTAVVVEVDVAILAGAAESPDSSGPPLELLAGEPAALPLARVHPDVGEGRGGHEIGTDPSADRNTEGALAGSEHAVDFRRVPAGVAELDHPAAIPGKLAQKPAQDAEIRLEI